MKKIRFIANFALTGFTVSFIAGLFSRRGFLSILLFALLFAAVFALLGFVVQLLLSSVLTVDSQPRSNAPAGTGNLVDIVVKDEELPGEGGSPAFHVGENRQMLYENDYGGDIDVDTIHEVSQNGAASEKDASDGDVQDGVSAPSGAATVAAAKKAGGAAAATYNPLDELPSFDNLDELAAGNIAGDDKGGVAGEAGGAQSGAAQGGTFSESKKEKANSGKGFSDAEATLMAKAISTVLAKDKE